MFTVTNIENGLWVAVRMGCTVSACIVELRQHGPISPRKDSDLARLRKELVAVLEFNLIAVVLAECEVDRQTVGFLGAGHSTEPNDPVRPVPLTGKPPAKAPGVSRVVKGGIGPIAPIHELGTRILGIGVVVEDVEGRKISSREDEPILGNLAGHLVEVG